MLLTKRLSASIQETHTRIEQLPLARAMMRSEISLEEYCTLAGQLYQVHLLLETLVQSHTQLNSLSRQTLGRADDLLTDVATLSKESWIAESFDSTDVFTTQLREEARDSVPALVGCLYVLEGSRMGSMALARPLARALGVEVKAGTGLDYHIRDITMRPRFWSEFKQKLDSMPWTPEEEEEITKWATITMTALYDIYSEISKRVAVLHPQESKTNLTLVGQTS